jgi:hypothetical protein
MLAGIVGQQLLLVAKQLFNVSINIAIVGLNFEVVA